MANWRGKCPQCGVEMDVAESSPGSARQCENCGFTFARRRFSLFGCFGNLVSLVAVTVFLLFCSTAIAVFIAVMNFDLWPAAGVQPAAEPAKGAAAVETVTPQEAAPQSPSEPPAVAQEATSQEPAVEPKTSVAPETRTWTDKSGKFSTEARFGGMAGDAVTLHKTDGTTIKLKLDQLSEADREWIEARRKHSVTKPRQ